MLYTLLAAGETQNSHKIWKIIKEHEHRVEITSIKKERKKERNTEEHRKNEEMKSRISAHYIESKSYLFRKEELYMDKLRLRMNYLSG